MKVFELIEELRQVDPDAEVQMFIEDDYFKVGLIKKVGRVDKVPLPRVNIVVIKQE